MRNLVQYEMVILAIQDHVRVEGNQKKAAESFGIIPAYLSDILRGNRDVPNSVLGKIGLRKRVIYEWVGDADDQDNQ